MVGGSNPLPSIILNKDFNLEILFHYSTEIAHYVKIIIKKIVSFRYNFSKNNQRDNDENRYFIRCCQSRKC